MSLCEPCGGVRKALVADTKWTGALRAEDAVSGWGDWAALRHVIIDPLDFIARLVALIPKPGVILARYHGVFSRGGLPPNSRWRDQVTPGSRGNGAAVQTEHQEEGKAKRRGMSCTEGRPAQRLKRVFAIDVEVCPHCGGGVRIIACIEDPVVIRQILSHVEAKQTCNRQPAGDVPPSRAPPPIGLVG